MYKKSNWNPFPWLDGTLYRKVYMSPEKQQVLFDKYPQLFKQKDWPPSQTCMCFGIECGDGWYWLIDELCAALQYETDKFNAPQVQFSQIKEKFGELRIYTDSNDSNVQKAQMDFAEDLSNKICENCGQMGATKTKTGYVKTLCEKCKKEFEK
jgi:hypothetical protein